MLFKVTRGEIRSVDNVNVSVLDKVIDYQGEKCIFTYNIKEVENYRYMLESEAKENGL